MRIPSGKTDQLIFFVAVDSTDLKTRKTGLTTFTVYRSRNGGTATVYTTPTVAELSTANMPGVYSLAIDEDTTIASTSDSEEYCVHITQASMAPVTRTIELYRRDTTTGNQLLVDSSGRVDVIKVAGTTQTARDIGASVLLSSGTGAGQLDFTSGVVKANATQILGTTIPTPATAGVLDVNVKNVNNVVAATPGASGGMLISGSNSGTTTLAALTVTGTMTVSDGLVVTRSTSNTSAASFTGNGSGDGVRMTGGLTGNGAHMIGGGTSGNGTLTEAPTAGNGLAAHATGSGQSGIEAFGDTDGHGVYAKGGANLGHGVLAQGGSNGTGVRGVGGSSAGSGILGIGTAGNANGIAGIGQGSGAGGSFAGGATGPGVKGTGGATSGDAVILTATLGHGLNSTGGGADKHGALFTGSSTSGVCDGFKAAAGFGGADARFNLTGNVIGTIDSLGTQAKSDVNAEVVDALNVDTYAEPGQETPPATTSLQKKISFNYKLARNKVTNDGTTVKVYNNGGGTVDNVSAVSETAGTVTRGEFATGP